MKRVLRPAFSSALASSVCLALVGCATIRNASAPRAATGGGKTPAVASATNAAAGAATAPAARPAAVAADPAALRAFADVVKDAKQTAGFLPLWKKDERIWIEISPEQLDKPMFLGMSFASGLGEGRFMPGYFVDDQVVYFKRVGNTVQLLAQNQRMRVTPGTPLAATYRENFSDSLLAAAPVVSAPHPERKTFLIDAAVLLAGDIAALGTAIEATYRLSYGHDRANSQLESGRTAPTGTSFVSRMHFSVAKLPLPPAIPPAPGTPLPTPVRTVPDARSFFLSVAYTFAPLPAEPLRPRLADQRVGLVTDAFVDLTTEANGLRNTHYIRRWRLEKKDPAAAVSEPKEPIVVWMDKNIPEQYRAAMKEGVLEWNKAFERAGYRNAIEVRQQPADADWNTYEGTRHIALRWYLQDGSAPAVAWTQSDPRTGEILRGFTIIPESWARGSRQTISTTLPKPPAAASLDALLKRDFCSFAVDAYAEMQFGLELLTSRRAIAPDSPEAERFVLDSLRDVVTHEIGHALGLRHNFKASAQVKLDQLRDAAWVRRNGLTRSVMDYQPLNIPLENEAPTEYHQATLGEYDYWVIEYAYRDFAPAAERAGLAEIAARSDRNPALAYATDEDSYAFLGGGQDPTANQFDLGDDPLAWYRRRIALTRELWTRTQKRQLDSTESYAIYRRNLLSGLGQIGFIVPAIGKYIGGLYTNRDLPGGARPLVVPVPAAKQREALELLTKEIFSADSFRFDPNFMSRLGVDHLDQLRRLDAGEQAQAPEFSLGTSVIAIQRPALDRLMNDGLAVRMADSEGLVKDRRQLLSFAEVQDALASAVWSELRTGRDIDALRRTLQREHLRRLAASVLRPTSAAPADVRAVHRQVALKLQGELRRAANHPGYSAIARAHVAESLTTLTDALQAGVIKPGA
jgi:hypothetical protein